MKLSEYYTIEQVADFFGVSRPVIVDAIGKEIIKAERFGRKKVVIHKSQIERFKTHRKMQKSKVKRPPLKPGEYKRHGCQAYTVDRYEAGAKSALESCGLGDVLNKLY